MILPICTFVALLAVPTLEQGSSSTPLSPCPNVFQYEPPGSEPGRWYGVVNLSTDSTLHSLWLNIVLDNKADILGNWVGDVSTQDNKDFKIENADMQINPGPATAVRFFVQYNPLNQTPRLITIRLNGREICNANSPQPAVNRPELVEETSVRRPTQRPETRPNFGIETKPIREPPRDNPSPVFQRPSGSNNAILNIPSDSQNDNRDRNQINRDQINRDQINRDQINRDQINRDQINRDQINRDQMNRDQNNRDQINRDQINRDQINRDQNNRDRDNGYQLTTLRTPQTPRPTVSGPGDYWEGPAYIHLPSKPSSNSNRPGGPSQSQCGKVILNPIPLVVNGTPTLEGQWPWHIALYQTQTVDNKYICGGTLVTHKHVITAAHCVTRKSSQRVVDHNTLQVYLGKHNLRTSVDGVQIRFVKEIFVNPNYNASTFGRDVAILELREPVTYTDRVRPACLWPENEVDLKNVIGKKGAVVGWGFDITGVATEELSMVEMPVVSQETCIRSYSEFFVRFTSEYTYCAGDRDGTSVCNGDSGGGMVFRMDDGVWYLRGLVSLSVARPNEYRCDPTHYVIFTDLAKFLPWIYDTVSDF